MGECPLLIATTHRDPSSTAASAVEPRSLRRNLVEQVMAIGGTRCDPIEFRDIQLFPKMSFIFECRNRNPRQTSRFFGGSAPEPISSMILIGDTARILRRVPAVLSSRLQKVQPFAEKQAADRNLEEAKQTWESQSGF
jgi:hypothetical protein